MPGKVILFQYNIFHTFGLEALEYKYIKVPWVEFEEQMLEWNFYNFGKMEKIEGKILQVYQNVFRALLKLDGFVSIMAAEVREEAIFVNVEEALVKVYFNSKLALEFGNYEHKRINTLPGRFFEFASQEWSTSEWENFFQMKLTSFARDNIEIAKENCARLNQTRKHFESVLQHLGKLPEEIQKRPMCEFVLEMLADYCGKILEMMCIQSENDPEEDLIDGLDYVLLLRNAQIAAEKLVRIITNGEIPEHCKPSIKEGLTRLAAVQFQKGDPSLGNRIKLAIEKI